MAAVAKQNQRTRQEWAAVINGSWRASIEGIIQVGRDLAAAKDELGHGEFVKMIEADLDFSRQTAHKLMAIAAHPAISNVAPGRHLPRSWTILEQLTRLDNEVFQWAEKRGLITPDTSKAGARAIVKAITTDERVITSKDAPRNLPKPAEARKIARETGKLVQASDGYIYTGATKEEGVEQDKRRHLVYGVRRAVETLANVGMTADEFLKYARPHQLWRTDEAHQIEEAHDWLAELFESWEAR